MRIMKKAISFALILSLLLALSVSALAADTGYGQYIKLSKEPLDWVHIVGTMPAIAGNPEVPIDDTAYLMPDDAPRRCAHYYCSAAGEVDCTEVYVVPASRFPEWLAAEQADDLKEDTLYVTSEIWA